MRKERIAFLFAAERKTGEVAYVAMSPPETERNDRLIEIALVRRHRELRERYPAARYDLIVARSESFSMLKRGYPELRLWEKAKLETLKLQ